jgi:hypothetical protein
MNKQAKVERLGSSSRDQFLAAGRLAHLGRLVQTADPPASLFSKLTKSEV